MDLNTDGIKNIVIIGSGVMGSSICQVFATAGRQVRLVDIDDKALQRAMRIIESGLTTLFEHGALTKEEITAAMTRITTGTDLPSMVADADFIIEAVPEIPEIKKSIFARLEECCPDRTVIASNTSGLNIFELIQPRHPQRFVIAHFFAPAHIIPLVEVVPGPETAAETTVLTCTLLKEAGKIPVELKTFIPSFIVNRIQNAIGTTVVEMLENGWATPHDIDLAIKYSLGIRLPIVGVVQTADFNGLDLVCNIFKNIGKESAYFNNLVAQGRLGIKTSKGLFDYEGRSEEEILKKRDALFLSMLDHMKRIKAFDPV